MTELTLAASEDAPSKSVVARASGPHRSAMWSSPAGGIPVRAAANPSGSLYYRRWFRSVDPNCRTTLIMALSRRNRERRRRALACITVQLRRSELDALIACGFLGATEREDRRALAAAHRDG
jgi:hypothetical protein